MIRVRRSTEINWQSEPVTRSIERYHETRHRRHHRSSNAPGRHAAVYAQAPFAAGQLVKTTSGAAIGQASSWRPAVSEYLGVPFAAPAVGALRWTPPQPFRGAGGTIRATNYVSHCPPRLEIGEDVMG